MGLARPKYDRHGAAIYRSPRWKRVRFLVKKRDGWRCVACGASGVRLEVDHKKPIREAPELAYEMGNLQTLCVPCHSRKTRLETGMTTPVPPSRRAWKRLVAELSQDERKSVNA